MKTSKINTKQSKGFVLTAELILLVTILILGSVIGMVSMRDSLNAEMDDVSEAIGALDQGYEFDGIVNDQATATIAGSTWDDAIDALAGDGVGFAFTAAGANEATVNGGAYAGAVDAGDSGTVTGAE